VRPVVRAHASMRPRISFKRRVIASSARADSVVVEFTILVQCLNYNKQPPRPATTTPGHQTALQLHCFFIVKRLRPFSTQSFYNHTVVS